MIPKSLQVEWSPAQLSQIVGQFRSGESEQTLTDLIHHLRITTKLPVERISKLELMPNMGGMIITFGDGSGVTMLGEPLTRFLSEYIMARESFISIMEHNRKSDPRVTGELARVEEELRLTQRELKDYQEKYGTEI